MRSNTLESGDVYCIISTRCGFIRIYFTDRKTDSTILNRTAGLCLIGQLYVAILRFFFWWAARACIMLLCLIFFYSISMVVKNRRSSTQHILTLTFSLSFMVVSMCSPILAICMIVLMVDNTLQVEVYSTVWAVVWGDFSYKLA